MFELDLVVFSFHQNREEKLADVDNVGIRGAIYDDDKSLCCLLNGKGEIRWLGCRHDCVDSVS